VAIVPNGRAGEHVRIYDSAAIGSFAELARDRRAQNVEDRLSEALLIGEDEMAMELAAEERTALVEGIVSRLDRIVGKLNPIEIEDEHPALKHLRGLKPFVQASGDLKVIDAYNTAIKALKQRSRRVLQADTGGSLAKAASWHRLSTEIEAAQSFEAAAKAAGARMRGECIPEEQSSRARALDSNKSEDWVAAQREAGRKMREKKY